MSEFNQGDEVVILPNAAMYAGEHGTVIGVLNDGKYMVSDNTGRWSVYDVTELGFAYPHTRKRGSNIVNDSLLSVEEEIEVIRKRQDEQEAAWERIREIDANTDECGNISNQEYNESERLRRRAEELRHKDEMYMDCDYRLMLDHIAALREQVAELTRERDDLKATNLRYAARIDYLRERGNVAIDGLKDIQEMTEDDADERNMIIVRTFQKLAALSENK